MLSTSSCQQHWTANIMMREINKIMNQFDVSLLRSRLKGVCWALNCEHLTFNLVIYLDPALCRVNAQIRASFVWANCQQYCLRTSKRAESSVQWTQCNANGNIFISKTIFTNTLGRGTRSTRFEFALEISRHANASVCDKRDKRHGGARRRLTHDERNPSTRPRVADCIR